MNRKRVFVPGQRRLFLGALALLFCWPVGAAQPPGKLPSPVFVVHTTAGMRATGPLLRLAADWSVSVGSGKSTDCKGAELVSVRRVGVPLPAHTLAAQVVFANGDRVPLDLTGTLRVAEDRLHFRPRLPLIVDEDFRPPLSAVAVLWLRAPKGTEDAELFLRRLLDRQRGRDLVLLHNGDHLEGAVLDLDAKTVCRLKVGKQVQEIPFKSLAAVAFSSGLLTPGLPKTPYAQLVLSDGGRLSLEGATLDKTAKLLQGKTLFGAAVQVAVHDLIALELRQGKAVYLSDLDPSKYEYTPFLGGSWPYVKDGSVTGRGLCLKSGTHDKGLGMHARSRLSYKIGGKYHYFEALVGLDTQTAKMGRARVQVLLDGKEQALGGPKELTARDGALAIRVDVRQAKMLTLVVDFGRQGDVQAHVNWADARLLP